jgi:type II secretory pathway component GspD/PulD (secretin)
MICSRTTLMLGLCLLATGLARAGEEVKSAPRMVETELLIAETARVAVSEDGELNLSEPADKLRASLLELEKQGKLDAVARVRLASVENLLASIQVGQTTGFVEGLSQMPNSTTVNVTERVTGLVVGVTACCQADRQISVKLDVNHSRFVPRPQADAKTKDAGVVLPPQTATATLTTTVLIPDGQTVVVGGTGAQTSDQTTVLVILATARVQNAAPR